MIDAIVLAAGLATRMGESKPLVPIEGEPALSRVLRRIREAEIGRPIVVVGAGSARAIADAVDLAQCTVIRNDSPETGMSSSLRLGIAAVAPNATGVLVFHADMPFIRTETIRAVRRAAEDGASIAAPVHEERRGFPVFFHQSHLPELRLSLSGDMGGRSYIDSRREELVLIAVDDPGCVHDLDRPSDLAAWEGSRKCATGA